MLSFSLQQHHQGSAANAFTFAVPMVFSSHLGNFHFGSSGCTFFNSWAKFFFIFKSFRSLGLGLRLGLPSVCFCQAYCTLMHYCHITGHRWWSNKVSNMKIDRQFC